jgi:hypothetical protein
VTPEPASRPAKDSEIWIICGNACAGKTTTARLLAQRLPRAAHIDGDEMQRLIVSGCRWAVPSDTDPATGRLTGEAGVQYALRIRNACLVAAAFADAGITAVVTDSIINEGFESLAEILGGRRVSFVVLRPPVAVLRQRGIDRLPEEAAYLAARYGDSAHPEAAEFDARVQAAADGRLVNEFEGVIERGLDRLPRVGLWVDPSGLDPQSVVDLLLDRQAEATWVVHLRQLEGIELLVGHHVAGGYPADGVRGLANAAQRCPWPREEPDRHHQHRRSQRERPLQQPAVDHRTAAIWRGR